LTGLFTPMPRLYQKLPILERSRKKEYIDF
jgi:hypothetical protein